MATTKPDKRKSHTSYPGVQQPRSNGFRLLPGILAVAVITSLTVALCGGIANWHLPAFCGRLLDALALQSSVDFAVDPESCPQYDAVFPDAHFGLLAEVDEKIADEGWSRNLFQTFSGALQIPTVSVDGTLPFPDHADYAAFNDLHAYLANKFPLVHARLQRKVVNSYALVFHWEGKDSTLKPMILTGHQDVVPVDEETADQWKYPPFSGHYDGEWIYGRGAIDCKPVITSQLASIEILLEKGFKPTRTIVLAFGFDEEIGGALGATFISRYLEETYGPDSFSILIDEGFTYESREDLVIAAIAVTEPGFFISRTEISIPGGHAARAPPHTSIEMIAAYIMELEMNRPPLRLSRESPYYQRLLCGAKFDPSMSAHLSALIRKSQHSDSALDVLVAELSMTDDEFAASTSSFQSIATVQGGSGIGMVPDNAEMSAGYLVGRPDSVSDMKARMVALAEPLAKKYNLSLDAFGTPAGDIEDGRGFGRMSLSPMWDVVREPSPVAPMFGTGSWMFLAGTIKSALTATGNSSSDTHPKSLIVAPTVVTGFSDAALYSNLTPAIYRYVHVAESDQQGVHTINEAIRATAVLDLVRFYARLIVNSESSLLDL